MTELSVPLDDLKRFMLDILDEFTRVCELHGLTYYLAFGSLLGAARHKGFIPWDDDIDLWMPPADYLALRKACEESLGDCFYFQSHGVNPENYISWQRIGVKNSTSLVKELSNIHCEWGVCIDIFPLIPYPDDRGGQKKKDCLIDEFRRLSSRSLYREEARLQTGWRKAYSIWRSRMPLEKNLRRWEELQEEILAVDDFKTAPCMLGSHSIDPGIKAIYPAKAFQGATRLSFEGRLLPAPAGWRDILCVRYGDDWHEIPDESKRICHSGGGSEEVIVSLSEPYENYLTNA